MLYIFETCERTIWEFEHWQYNEYSGKAADRKDQSEKPQDKDDHMIENLGRALIHETDFVIMPQPGTVSNFRSMPKLDPND